MIIKYIKWSKVLFFELPISSTFAMSNFNKYYIMKKLTKKNLIILLMLASFLSYANDGRGTFKEKEKVTNLSFKNVKLGSMLTIRDDKGLVLYKESIVKSGQYSKGFDLTALPNGDYYFELDTDFEIVVIPFDVVSNQVNFRKDEKSTIFKPFVRVKDNMVYVSKVSYNESPLEYKIYYAENYDLVLSEKFENEKQINKIYDFSESKEGEYLFVFKFEGRKYSKKIKI